VSSGLLHTFLFLVANTPVAGMVALIATFTVLTGHFRSVKVGFVNDKKAHQKAYDGNEHEGV
jgi:FlaG/FlaF family flagellin (archaellin)